MKKLIGLVIALALSTPSFAHEQHEHRRNNDTAIVGILGAVVAGAIIAGDRADRRGRYYGDRYERYDPYNDSYNPYAYDRYTTPARPRYYEHYCVTEQYTDYYGRIRHRRICQ